MTAASRRILPGFRMSLSFTLGYLLLLVLVPLVACVWKASSLSAGDFWRAVWTGQARSAYLLTYGASLAAALADTALGLLIAWVLVRYEFPGKKIVVGQCHAHVRHS